MADNLRTRILQILVDRIPNYVSEVVLRSRLPDARPDQIAAELAALVAADQVETQVDQRPAVGEPVTYYRLKAREGLPIRQTITVGDVVLPRLLSDSSPALFPENFNEALEQLSEHSKRLEDRFRRLVAGEQRRYWANAVGIFSVLVSVLALILAGLPKITTDPSLPFWVIVKVNLSQLLPLAFVLALLVVAMRWIVR